MPNDEIHPTNRSVQGVVPSSGPLGAPNASLKSGCEQEISTDEAGWIGDEAMSAERGWIGDPQPSVEWRDSHYSRQADRINTQPDPCGIGRTGSRSRASGGDGLLTCAGSSGAGQLDREIWSINQMMEALNTRFPTSGSADELS
jgi:hypothetical protein